MPEVKRLEIPRKAKYRMHSRRMHTARVRGVDIANL
jgi:hypothetical protein